MRRVLAAALSILVVGLAGGAAVAVGAGSVAPAPSPSRLVAPRPRLAPTVQVPYGSACFVGLRTCSETPCVELIAGRGRPSTATAVQTVGLHAPRVTERCSRAPMPGIVTQTVTSRLPSVTPRGDMLQRLKTMRQELATGLFRSSRR